VGFEEDVPYSCIVVELVEQPELLIAANLVGSLPREAEVGRPVEVAFVEDSRGFTLPQFRLSGTANK
jgi:uncharacterized OB-fold protein